MDLDGEMRQHAEISRTASKEGVEQLGISGLGDFFGLPLVVHYLERDYVVSKQAKTASQLAISTGLDMAPEVNFGTLSVGHEYLVLREICVEFPEAPANARANQGYFVRLENGSVVGTSESHFQVQLDVLRGGGRGTTILMASSSDGHSDILGFGVLERKGNIILVVRLDDQPWVHVVVYFVGGGGILVLFILIRFCSLRELLARYAGDSGHDAQLRVLKCVGVFRFLCTAARQAYM